MNCLHHIRIIEVCEDVVLRGQLDEVLQLLLHTNHPVSFLLRARRTLSQLFKLFDFAVKKNIWVSIGLLQIRKNLFRRFHFSTR